MYSKTAQRLNKLSYQNVLNLFLQLLNNILYFSFRKLIVYYKYYILTKKNFFEKKSEFKCDRIPGIVFKNKRLPVYWMIDKIFKAVNILFFKHVIHLCFKNIEHSRSDFHNLVNNDYR